MPQYVLGHIEKLAALDEGMSGLPGVFLTGAAFRGVGLPDCIKQAALAARKAPGLRDHSGGWNQPRNNAW